MAWSQDRFHFLRTMLERERAPGRVASGALWTNEILDQRVIFVNCRLKASPPPWPGLVPTIQVLAMKAMFAWTLATGRA
ncbi:hypothetical protein B5U98_25835 [Bosea sp. Tri-39]|nr:hypothetical protein BLM15_14595 [Bosea sp. Tri-49]RXT17495.1 hypothetical protein B5U98_25835 [Bosea sp. Tri-39]RXT40867.1 hypothetical protein B5U99_03705 [Bosea sp. Tri-54]